MIRVEEYNAEWPTWFEKLRAKLWPAVEEFAVTIEHVGSTSVPGLAAKAVIDIDIVVESESKLPFVIAALKNLGYEHRGNLGIEGREAFRIVDPIKHNLYVCIQNCTALKNHLALRNHLRQFPNSRDEYSALKLRLAVEFADSIDGYIEGKSSFIISVISQYGLSASELKAIEDSNRAK
jgi:GrpB-like predicted nucleotidyltransferase (UPF0157 family)